jgi:hypothetical protein
MKSFILAILGVCLVAGLAFAGSGGGSITDPEGAYSTPMLAGVNTTTTSGAFAVNRNLFKTIVFTSMSSNGTVTTTLPGTAVIKCGNTSAGPWVQAKDLTGASISATSPSMYTMEDFCQWLELVWTQTSGAHSSITATLYYSD